MSQYTMTVYELLKNGFDFGLQDYDIFNEDYRPILNNAILNFYKWHEIGFQFPEMFKDRLNERMNRIMRDKYNNLYKNKFIEFNPLFNIDITETFSHEIENNSQANQTGTSNAKNESATTNENISSENSKGDTLALSSQFPSEEMTENDLSSNLYIDNAQKQKATQESNNNSKSTGSDTSTAEQNSTTTATSTGNQSESYTKTTKGSSAGLPFSKAMLQFQEFCNKFDLDKQVIDELSDLFISLW